MNNELHMQLDHIIDALAADLYHPLGDIRPEGFVTREELTLAEAEARPRAAMPEGTAWGQPRDYAWMFASFTLPPESAGERIVMDLDPGGESTLFLNGKPFGTKRADRMDHPHHYIVDQLLTEKASGGETFRLAMETYAGTPLPADPGRPVFPEDGVRFIRTGPAVMGRNTFGLWNEEAYQLWLDLTVIRDLDGFLNENDALKEAIGAVTAKLLDALDMEQPLKARRDAYIRAREIIAPVMNAKNGTFAPSMGVVGNSHLDLAWLWPLGETRRKTARTFAAQLRLLKEYPEALFLQSQCAEYELCRKHYPDLFEEIKKAISGGQWIAEGGMWVEPDTNLAGGESLVRQFLYGKRYFREMLGVDSRIVWLPDTFGYSAALPQIIKGFGMKGLTTQKIFWSYNDSEPFPYHAFEWQGLDGSRVPAYLHMFYETQVEAKTLHTRWISRLERDGSCDFYLPFGYGDGGGGPTRDDMELIRRQKDLQGSPRLYWCGPEEYLEKRNDGTLPVYRGELYFPCHRGTYTTQAAIKKGNRRCERALRAWEMLEAVSAFTGRSVYPKEKLEETWKLLLINQFHDILPGSAINDVYVQARKDHSDILASAAGGAADALALLAGSGDGIAVFNPASHRARMIVHADKRFARGACAPDGTLFPAAETADGADVLVTLAPMSSVTLIPADTGCPGSASLARENGLVIMENGLVRAKLDDRGRLVSFVTLADGRERVRSASNVFHLYRDLPRRFDAWDIDSQTERREVTGEPVYSTEVTASRGMYAEVTLTVRVSGSVITQRVRLYTGETQLRFVTDVDWHERHRLLKVSFDTGIDADNAKHQIQFGYIERPAHRSRRYDADRFEVCAHTWSALTTATDGAALINDSKYGVSVCDGVISLSLLRAPTYPDAEADLGHHTFTYAYKPWSGAMDDCGLAEASDTLNEQPVTAKGSLDLPSLIDTGSRAIVTECVKLAEDGSGDLIIRLYESMNGTRNTDLRTAFPFGRAFTCMLSEEITEELPVSGNAVPLSFRPFEIKTIRLTGQ
ncbi:MAG: glycoside hydrolase family 38 C-terminal domain-containing protein [Clostridia bacterium]|nr:glycoside hydrolase family 38 C-terminal domain-containing protein [Clostridia bacterium]